MAKRAPCHLSECGKEKGGGGPEPFASMNADAEVMRYFPRPLTVEEFRSSRREFSRASRGKDGACRPWRWMEFSLGSRAYPSPSFPPALLPSWRLGGACAGSTGGRASPMKPPGRQRTVRFPLLHLDELVTLTTATNRRSRRLMERLGCFHDSCEDSMHLQWGEDDPLNHHVLYRKRADVGPVASPELEASSCNHSTSSI